MYPQTRKGEGVQRAAAVELIHFLCLLAEQEIDLFLLDLTIVIVHSPLVTGGMGHQPSPVNE